MCHKARIDILVCAGIDKFDLPATALFCWGTEETDTARDFVLLQGCDGPQKPSNRANGNEIMPAGMANPGKGIILTVEINYTPIGAIFG